MNNRRSIPRKKVVGKNEEYRAVVYQHLLDSAAIKRQTAETRLDSILKAANLIATCFRCLHKLLICGNGGSAADAQHMAAEFVNRLNKSFERPGLPAIALTTDTSFITSYANDYGYDGVFERQIRALGQRGDLLVGISTSGNSRNVIRAMVAAKELGIGTIGLIGEGGEMSTLANHVVVVPSRDTQHVQETLLAVEHAICTLVERELFAR